MDLRINGHGVLVMDRVKALAQIILSIWMLSPLYVFGSSKWELIDDELGIKVFRQDLGETDIDLVRAQMLIPASIDQLASILRDIDGFSNWMYGCIESKVISGSDERNFDFYYVYGTPWPYRDRDVVLNISTIDVLAQGWFEVRMISIDSDYTDNPDHLRVNKMEGMWHFERVSKVSSRVELELFIDPAGNVPDYIVNIVSPYVILETFKGLKKTANKVEFQKEFDEFEREQMEKALQDSGFM